MKFLVGYSGVGISNKALEVAREHARTFNARVVILTSMEGGSGEKLDEIERIEKSLEEAKALMAAQGIECETHQLARGLSPGEDVVKFAQDNAIDMIYVGIKKKSKAQKIILGSTAQYIILKAPCPVVAVK
jgi:nucleotide-binding universal stress UspA family protein